MFNLTRWHFNVSSCKVCREKAKRKFIQHLRPACMQKTLMKLVMFLDNIIRCFVFCWQFRCVFLYSFGYHTTWYKRPPPTAAMNNIAPHLYFKLTKARNFWIIKTRLLFNLLICNVFHLYFCCFVRVLCCFVTFPLENFNKKKINKKSSFRHFCANLQKKKPGEKQLKHS